MQYKCFTYAMIFWSILNTISEIVCEKNCFEDYLLILERMNVKVEDNSRTVMMTTTMFGHYCV